MEWWFSLSQVRRLWAASHVSDDCAWLLQACAKFLHEACHDEQIESIVTGMDICR